MGRAACSPRNLGSTDSACSHGHERHCSTKHEEERREEGGSNEAGFGDTAGYRYHTGGWQPGLVGSGVLAAAESPEGAMQWGICFYFP